MDGEDDEMFKDAWDLCDSDTNSCQKKVQCYKDNPNLPIAWSSSKSIPLDTKIQWIMHPLRHLVCNEVPATIDGNAGFILPDLQKNKKEVYTAAELGAWDKEHIMCVIIW